MVKLVFCEFKKLKRKHFLLLVAFTACLFPFPVTFLVMRSGTTDEVFGTILFMLMAWIGVPLMVPATAGIIASMLFNMERDNGTLKNLYAVPITWRQLAGAKIVVIFFLSAIFTVVTFWAALIAAILTGSTVTGIAIKLCASFLVGIFYASITLPAVFLVIWCNRNTVFSTLLSIVYAVIQEVLIWSGIYTISAGSSSFDTPSFQLWNLPMMIFRWFPYFIDTGHTHSDQPAGFFVPLWQIIAVSAAIAVTSIFLIFQNRKQREV